MKLAFFDDYRLAWSGDNLVDVSSAVTAFSTLRRRTDKSGNEDLTVSGSYEPL